MFIRLPVRDLFIQFVVKQNNQFIMFFGIYLHPLSMFPSISFKKMIELHICMTRHKSMQSKARPICPSLNSSKFSKAVRTVTDAFVYLIKTPTLI